MKNAHVEDMEVVFADTLNVHLRPCLPFIKLFRSQQLSSLAHICAGPGRNHRLSESSVQIDTFPLCKTRDFAPSRPGACELETGEESNEGIRALAVNLICLGCLLYSFL